MRTNPQPTAVGPRTIPALVFASAAWFLLLVVATYPAEAVLVVGAVVALGTTGKLLRRAVAKTAPRIKRRTICIPRMGVCIEIRAVNVEA